MDYSPNHSPGNDSDRSEYARRLGARVGVNFGPVFESVSYLMRTYCKSSYSLKSCLEALNSDEKMRKKIAREIWYHYTHGALAYDKLGVDLDEYNNAYTPPDEDGTKAKTGYEGAFVGNASGIVSNDDDDVETPTIKSDSEAAVGLTDDEHLTAAADASFDYDGGDGDDVRNDDDVIDADSDHYVDDVYNDGDDVNDDDADATVQSDHIDSDDVDDDDDVDNADDDATVQSDDTDGGYVNEDDVDDTDYYANDQFVVSDGDDVNNNNNEDDEDATVQSDDDSTMPSDYDDVVVGSPDSGDNSNICDSTDSSSPSDENVYTADSDEIRAISSDDDSANVPSEDNDSVSNCNFEELVSPNSYEENGDVNDDVDDAFNPSDEIVLPNSREGNGSDDLPLNNGEVNTPDNYEFVTTSDDDDDHSYITSNPVDNFLGTLQEQCMWLYRRGFGEGDGKFKPDPIRRRTRLKKLADFYFAEKMSGDYPRINYQKPTYHNGYEFGLTDYLRRLGKRLGVEFGPVFEGCAIKDLLYKAYWSSNSTLDNYLEVRAQHQVEVLAPSKMGRYFRSTRTLQRCVDIINNDEDMRKDLASSVWHHFIEGVMQKIR